MKLNLNQLYFIFDFIPLSGSLLCFLITIIMAIATTTSTATTPIKIAKIGLTFAFSSVDPVWYRNERCHIKMIL